MKHKDFALSIIVCTLLGVSPNGEASIVTFDEIPVGTIFGPSSNNPGDLIFVEDGISVTLEEFLSTSGTLHFLGPAQVFAFGDTPPGFANPPDLGSGHFMFISNISLEFDFTGLATPVTHLTVAFADGGGTENIAVNGYPTWAGSILSAPADIAPGVTLTVVPGLIELVGPIQSLRIAGQEFAIDNVIAVPAPSSIAVGLLVLFRRSSERRRCRPTNRCS